MYVHVGHRNTVLHSGWKKFSYLQNCWVFFEWGVITDLVNKFQSPLFLSTQYALYYIYMTSSYKIPNFHVHIMYVPVHIQGR